MSENVHVAISSVAPFQTAERLRAFGRALDAFPELAPTRMGPRDPPRTPTTSVEDVLATWAPTIHPGDYFNQFIVRADPHVSGLLWVTGDIWNYPPIGPHRFEFDVEEGWFDGPEKTSRLDRYADLFVTVAESMDAFWGEAGLTSLETPFVFDPSVDRMSGYAWKRPFYEALGRERILHEDWTDPGTGVAVPSYEEYRRFVAGS